MFLSIISLNIAEHTKAKNADGLLTTSLCEDLYSVVGVQLRTISECCCAAANEFIRMSDQCEEILVALKSATSFSKENLDMLAVQSNELLALYISDAVFAAHRVVYIFVPIEEEVCTALFDAEWEESLTHNELAPTMVRTLEVYMGDLEIWLEELMVRKVIDGLIIATINFYIKCLLTKADNKNAKESSFKDPQTAIVRMKGDIGII